MVLDGFLCQRFAVGLAVLIAEPPKVLGDTNTRDFIHRNPLELREDDFQNVGIHRHSSGAVGAVPNTERNPHFIDERIEGVDRSGSGEFTRHGSGFLFLDVVLSYLFFPDTRHLLGFLASLCGSEVCGRIPSGTFEELLAVGIPSQASLDLERDNFLSFYFFLNVSHPNHPFGGQRTKTADPVDFFVDPKTQKRQKVRKNIAFRSEMRCFWWR